MAGVYLQLLVIQTTHLHAFRYSVANQWRDKMKKITCAELGGACDLSIFAESFEEAAKQSQEHAMQMFKQEDKAHLAAAEKMKTMMSSPVKMDNWMTERRNYFNNLISER